MSVYLVQTTIDDLTNRVNKFENNSKVRSVLESTELSDASIDLIMNTLTEMQDKLDNQVSVKLEAYVSINAF